MEISFEETRVSSSRNFGLDYSVKDVNFTVEAKDNVNARFEKSRVYCDVEKGEDTNFLIGAASMVHRVRNEKLTRDSVNILVKRPENRFEVGDMVWGKVRSHPWWPGQIFHEAFALPCVSETKRENHVLVAFFGDNSYGWFDPLELIPFDINYVEKSMQTDAGSFVDAVEEAEDEARRRAALGLTCPCQNACNFLETGVKGFVEVDLCGYQPGGVYSVKQIKKARDDFRPFEMLCFVQKLASKRYSNLKRSINWIKNVAVVLAYRKAVFEEVDETYIQALGAQRIHGANSFGDWNSPEQVPSHVHPFGSKKTTLVPGPFDREATNVKNLAIEKISSVEAIVDRKPKREKKSERSQSSQQFQRRFKKVVEISQCLEKVQVVGRTPPPSDAVLHRKVIDPTREDMNGRLSVLNCLGEDLCSKETLVAVKRKRKKEFTFESCLKFPDNHLRNSKKEAGNKSNIFSSDGMATEQIVGLRSINSKLPQLLRYLLDLACNPLHGVEYNIPAIVLQFFLKLRREVYKKDLFVDPESEAKLLLSSPTKSPACSVAAACLYNGAAQDLPSASKPPKKRFRPEDYTNIGLNCNISDHEKEMPVEELRKSDELHLLAAEKKGGSWKLEKSKVRNDCEMDATIPTKVKRRMLQKNDTPTRTTKPTIIVMQFPHQSGLPSVSELKARFARFGQLYSAPRVFWRSSECQVLFKCKSDARKAYKYAVKSRSLFGSVKVEYQLQALETPGRDFPEPGKRLIGKAPDEVLAVKPMSSVGFLTKPSSMRPQHQLLHPMVQSKSCLRKQLSDDVIHVHWDRRHVKNMMRGEESIGAEQLVLNSNIKNSKGNHSNDSLSASATVNIAAKRLPNVIPPPLPPLPLRPNRISYVHQEPKLNHFVEVCNRQHLQREARNNCVFTATNQRSIDISNQMLNLLTRCHGIVTDLKCSLGYVPLNL